ncbi:hypothetical protein DL89DRAFT_153704 [Linderina pennispora]|uniref:Uncharacterized protein n=1 Tax=Linderina pennispora TaxID=61395 RepID=A0A1Y1W9J5_9FUNG|nr:uncharacterized protein DL89DRAFT_153704 [Linderina pennispora]ORX70201.1 hypothetical protein DL89DRAFT_153704 [Linderina pennispora]
MISTRRAQEKLGRHITGKSFPVYYHVSVAVPLVLFATVSLDASDSARTICILVRFCRSNICKLPDLPLDEPIAPLLKCSRGVSMLPGTLPLDSLVFSDITVVTRFHATITVTILVQ